MLNWSRQTKYDLWPSISLDVSISWLPSWLPRSFSIYPSLSDDMNSCCCVVDVLLAFSSPAPVLCQSWMKRLNFPTFPIVSVCLFSFFLFSVCAQTNTSSFSRLYCLVSSHSLWDEFGGRTRELCSPGTGRSSLLAMILISLAHEHSDSRKGKIPKVLWKGKFSKPMCSYYFYVHQSYTNTCMLITVFWLVFSMAHSCLAINTKHFLGLSVWCEI